MTKPVMKTPDRSSLTVDITSKRIPNVLSLMLTDAATKKTGENILTNTHFQEIPDSDYSHNGVADDLTGEAVSASDAVYVRHPKTSLFDLAVYASSDAAFALTIEGHGHRGERGILGIDGFIIRESSVVYHVGFSADEGPILIVQRELYRPNNGKAFAACHLPTAGDTVRNPPSRDFDCSSKEFATSFQETITAVSNQDGTPGSPANVNIVLSDRNDMIIPAGDHLVDRLELTGNSRLAAKGPARIFVKRGATFTDHTIFGTAETPITLVVAPGAPVTLGGTTKVFGVIHAPWSNISASGESRIQGRLRFEKAEIYPGAWITLP